jgi:hypothetical protein
MADRIFRCYTEKSPAGLSREEFYGSTKETGRKINLMAHEYPVPLA